MDADRRAVGAPLDGAGLAAAAAHLARRDPDLGRLLARDGPPPLWARPSGFATLVRIILEQQVSLASARAVFVRLRARTGRVTPAAVLTQGEPGLRASGLTRQKAAYVVRLAGEIESGALDLRALDGMSDATAHSTLVRLKGIGAWTADIYLLIAMRRPDIWPAGDIALQKTVRQVKRLRAVPTPERFARLGEAWRPYRSVAARMLWHHYLTERDGRRATRRAGATLQRETLAAGPVRAYRGNTEEGQP